MWSETGGATDSTYAAASCSNHSSNARTVLHFATAAFPSIVRMTCLAYILIASRSRTSNLVRPAVYDSGSHAIEALDFLAAFDPGVLVSSQETRNALREAVREFPCDLRKDQALQRDGIQKERVLPTFS